MNELVATILKDIREAKRNYKPIKEIRIHPDDLDELRLFGETEYIWKPDETTECRNSLNGVHLIEDTEALRIPRR